VCIDSQVKAFRRVLIEGSKVCTIRLSKGDDEMAACGQLGDPGLAPRPAPILKPPQRLQAAIA
jgi:23S rRNA (adenine2503-C2)-methyltransferase